MKIDFTMELTEDVMEQAMDDFDADYNIEDLAPDTVFIYTICALFGFESVADANNVIKCLSEDTRKAIVRHFAKCYTNRVTDLITEKLMS